MDELVDLMIEADESLLALLPTVADVEKSLNIDSNSGASTTSASSSDQSLIGTTVASSSSSSSSTSPANSSRQQSQQSTQQQQPTVDLVEAVARQGWLFKQSPAFHKVTGWEFQMYFDFRDIMYA